MITATFSRWWGNNHLRAFVNLDSSMMGVKPATFIIHRYPVPDMTGYIHGYFNSVPRYNHYWGLMNNE